MGGDVAKEVLPSRVAVLDFYTFLFVFCLFQLVNEECYVLVQPFHLTDMSDTLCSATQDVSETNTQTPLSLMFPKLGAATHTEIQ